MWTSLYCPGARVNTKLHRIERDAERAGCVTLEEYQAFRRARYAGRV